MGGGLGNAFGTGLGVGLCGRMVMSDAPVDQIVDGVKGVSARRHVGIGDGAGWSGGTGLAIDLGWDLMVGWR